MYILWCLLLCCGFSLHITQVEVIWNTYGLRIIHCVSCPYCSCSDQWPGVGRLTRTKPNLKNICCESSFVTTDLTWPAGGAVTVTRESPPNPAPCPVIASDSRVDICDSHIEHHHRILHPPPPHICTRHLRGSVFFVPWLTRNSFQNKCCYADFFVCSSVPLNMSCVLQIWKCDCETTEESPFGKPFPVQKEIFTFTPTSLTEGEVGASPCPAPSHTSHHAGPRTAPAAAAGRVSARVAGPVPAAGPARRQPQPARPEPVREQADVRRVPADAHVRVVLPARVRGQRRLAPAALQPGGVLHHVLEVGGS